MTEEIDLVDRDPKHLSDTVVKIDFVDVVAELEGTHSFNGIWKTNFTSFTLTKVFFYRLFSTILGIPMALFWGIYFAILSFIHIWLVGPLVRSYLIEVQYLGRIFVTGVHLFFDPLFESIGKIFSSVRATVQKEV